MAVAMLGWLRKRFAGNPIRETIGELLEEDKSFELAPEERTMITNILNVGDKTVANVMVPRADVQALDINTPYNELLSFVTEKPHSRYPVYQKTLDRIVGVLHVKSLLLHIAQNNDTHPPLAKNAPNSSTQAFPLRELLHPPLFCAPSLRVFDLLVKMQQERLQIAFVVDEYGGIDGMVTLEDVVEEIVGEIHDEHDKDWELICYQDAEGNIIADARLTIEQFEERFGTELGAKEVDTLGGLVVSLAGRVPNRGEAINDPKSKFEFRIVEASTRRISRLKIVAPPGEKLSENAEWKQKTQKNTAHANTAHANPNQANTNKANTNKG